MAKKSSIVKNKKRLALAERCKTKRQAILAIVKDQNASFEDRLIAQKKLSEMPRDSSLSRHRNRCNLTGRPRGNFRKFGLSRVSLRELASWGQVPGLVKSSW